MVKIDYIIGHYKQDILDEETIKKTFGDNAKPWAGSKTSFMIHNLELSDAIKTYHKFKSCSPKGKSFVIGFKDKSLEEHILNVCLLENIPVIATKVAAYLGDKPYNYAITIKS